jgi:hypothetical protein
MGGVRIKKVLGIRVWCEVGAECESGIPTTGLFEVLPNCLVEFSMTLILFAKERRHLAFKVPLLRPKW